MRSSPIAETVFPASAASSGRASCIDWTRTPRACSSSPNPMPRIRGSRSSSRAMVATAAYTEAISRSCGAGCPGRQASSTPGSDGAAATAMKIAVTRGEQGREAKTHYEVLDVFPGETPAGDVSLVRLVLETGRTHQIRVHLAHIGHPVLGDPTYGAGFKTRLAPFVRTRKTWPPASRDKRYTPRNSSSNIRFRAKS